MARLTVCKTVPVLSGSKTRFETSVIGGIIEGGGGGGDSEGSFGRTWGTVPDEEDA